MTDNNQPSVPSQGEPVEPLADVAAAQPEQPTYQAYQPQAAPEAAPEVAPEAAAVPAEPQIQDFQPDAPQAYQQAAPQAYQQAYQQAPAYQQPAPGYQQAPPPPYGQPQPGPAYAAAYDPQAKSRVMAGILGILLGSFGVHRFYLGYVGLGIAQIAVTFVTFGIGAWWGIIEGIMILAKAQAFQTDAEGRPLRDG